MSTLGFGNNLKQLRKKHGFSREYLAEKISYSKKSIEKWELNGALPPVETVCRLAEIFHVTVDSLLFEKGSEVHYLLGIDGGGTKTEFLLTDLEKNEIRRVVLGASNPVDIGIEACKRILEDGINRVCENISLREVSVFAGLAGGITGDHCMQINQFLSTFCFAHYANGSDVENVLEMALGKEDGMIVILGTGVVAFAQKDGKCTRIGGWGYLIDKGGSGYNFGADALDCALKFIDGRGGSEQIKDLIEKQIQKPLPESISTIYKNGKPYIASLAKNVFTAYLSNDPYAEAIIEQNMKEVAQLIQAGMKKLNENSNVVICGGLNHYADILKPMLEKQLTVNCNLVFMDEPIVNGAVSLAEKNIKKEKD